MPQRETARECSLPGGRNHKGFFIQAHIFYMVRVESEMILRSGPVRNLRPGKGAGPFPASAALVRRLVFLHDVGLDPAATVDVQSLFFGPGPDL